MDDYVYTKRRARKRHICVGCKNHIEPGQEYWEITIGGGGLTSLKFPDRAHLTCALAFVKMKEAKRGNQGD